MRSATIGFTEPYFLDKPIQVGVNFYLTRYDFNQGQQALHSGGQNLSPIYAQLGTQNLLNYVQNGHGFSVSSSYQLPAQFCARRDQPTGTTGPASVR